MTAAAPELARVPRRRPRSKCSLRPVEKAAWVYACELAVDEAEQGIEARRRGVLALVRRLVAEVKRTGRPWVDLSRRQIAELLGFEGAAAPAGSRESGHAEEAVRRLLRRAELAGELLTFREAGHKFKTGVPSHKIVIVRLLWRLDALPRPLRLAALGDPHVSLALEALRRATLAQEASDIASRAGGAPSPSIAAPEGAGCVLEAPPPLPQPPPTSGGPASGSFSLSDRFRSSTSSPPSGGAGTAAPAAREAGAERRETRPAAPVTPPALDPIEPVGPPAGPEPRRAPADDRTPAVVRGQDGRVSLDLGRLREVRSRCEELLAELRREELVAEAAASEPLPLGGWRTPDLEARGRAELARRRDRELEVRRLAAIIADAKVAARVGWKLHRAAEPKGGPVFTSPQETRDRLEAAAAALEAHRAELADAPPAWCRLFPALVERIDGLRPDGAGGRRVLLLEDLAALRCVADDGDALVLQARDGFHRERVRDLGLGFLVGELAVEVLERELAIEVR